eukprot:m.13420 g.13420  ORF g.13420 m.13420 type:complete len:62 (-) comp4151_c0_seq1:2236-2421(-)
MKKNYSFDKIFIFFCILDLSSSFTIVSKCTSSGPSAIRSVRAPVNMNANGVSSDIPAAPNT